MSNFTEPKRIIRSFAAVIAGSWIYCLVLAPAFLHKIMPMSRRKNQKKSVSDLQSRHCS